jgi:exodeoxyribonuclease V gamma subunit
LINIYPSNRLENLLILLDKVMQISNKTNALQEEIILVQSKGMQHWLNLKLAETRGISMNLSFSLPMQFFWTQIRVILGKGLVPEHSTYNREVLSWRIYDLLASEKIINQTLCDEVSYYWLKNKKQANKRSRDDSKRFQLACQLADLYEQYLIFRPDWITDWSNQSAINQPPHWQALIWQLLIEHEPLHPIALLKQAMVSMEKNKHLLADHISLFGINTLPPLWLNFLSELGQYTQVHFFHLNPCVEYWGDLKTDKTKAKEYFYRWVNNPTTAADSASYNESLNPLLANLGSQGKEFVNLLQDHCSVEIPLYESPEHQSSLETKNTTLEKIQSDILNLYDARGKVEKMTDKSIVINSAHSALRETQALHDWLLHQINNDPTLTPKDILVMCPNIENYAPYVDAVFAHGWNNFNEHIPPLPCSIADRTLKDSEPLVQAFIQLLELPDSRFQTSQIMSFLRLPAIQTKFSFIEDDILLLERWIKHASIHWGFNAQHKQHILSVEEANEKFTWQQGLERLLLGFAFSDQETIYQEQLLLPDVEGDEALLLGRFFELLEQLKLSTIELQRPKKADQWKAFLHQSKESLFQTLSTDTNALQTIDQAIDSLGEYTFYANYHECIPLPVIRDFLVSHFNQAEPGRQFMSGQVTFCSMVPMRSIPFRIIAVLGLNDGEFPRQRQAMGFDLMAKEPPRIGDRSRRGDDRYLFLEALISCRDKLYLSYQGHDIKTNNQREPSLVLNELMDYLDKSYGYESINIPMQAFSLDNYKQPINSFNPHWLKLSEPGQNRNNLIKLKNYSQDSEHEEQISISAEELIQFFDNPCKAFAQKKLGLFLDTNEGDIAEDSEPFATTHLDRYLIQEQIITTTLSESKTEEDLNNLLCSFDLSGKYPDTPNAKDDIQQWQDQSTDFALKLKTHGVNQVITKTAQIAIDGINIEAELPYLDDNLLFWRLANPKGKDDMRLWVHHLIANIIASSNNSENTKKSPITQGVFRGEKEESVQIIQFSPPDNADELLKQLIQCWKQGMQQALLLNASLGQKHCMKQKGKLKPLDNFTFKFFWEDAFQIQGLGSDPYIHWFWSGDNQPIPQWEGDWKERIELIYSPLYEHRQ